MKADLIIVIGAYGSGKSEYSINLAEQYNSSGNDVFLIDLDVVNPYFRSRDVRDFFAEKGISVISPEGDYNYADLPMISPKIAGAISQEDKTVILDVGGDPSGCRALARFTEGIKKRGYQMHFVVNTLRPFTGNVEDVMEMLDMLELSSKLEISEIVANINLLNETEEKQIEEGIEILEQVAGKRGVAFEKYLVIEEMKEKLREGIRGKKRSVMHYYLRKPWENLSIKGL